MDDRRSLAERIALLRSSERRDILAALTDHECGEIAGRWLFWARRGQLPPPRRWSIWLVMAGRGFGKTRGGAEWVHEKARIPGVRIAIAGPTEDEARRVMIEGSSGLLATAPGDAPVLWEPSLGRLRWTNGAQAFVYSGANADGLRGPEHDFAWADEIAKWAQAEAAWSNLRLGLRRGRFPQLMATTTPRPTALLRRLVNAPDVAVTGGATQENSGLSEAWLADMAREHGGTRHGRQELGGELIEDVAGALWTRAMIERCRGVTPAGGRRRVVIGVDPPASAGGDACGIVAAALDQDGRAHVIEDASLRGASPDRWAAAVADCAARTGADRVIAEANNGGEMVASVLRAADAGLPVKLVHASRGKSARAEPVAALYERGRVIHDAAFPELEDELCGILAGGGYEGPGRSPDRADALVWALTEMMLGRAGAAPRVRVL